MRFFLFSNDKDLISCRQSVIGLLALVFPIARLKFAIYLVLRFSYHGH